MRLKAPLIMAIALTLLMGGTAPSPFQRPDIQHDLAALTKRGFTYHMLDNDVIELTDPVSGEKHLKTLREPSEASIRSWAAARGVPILEIDPTQVDTKRYGGWYNFWTTVPLWDGIGVPLLVGDINRNGRADVYGVYLDTLSTEYQTRLYEVDSSDTILLQSTYVPGPGISRQFLDADGDSLKEVAWSRVGLVSGYEQNSADSLPVHLVYAYERYYHNWDPGYTGIYFGNLDGDSLTDFLYQGTGPDPNDTNIAISKTYVAEYDPGLQNFVRVWSTQFYPNSGAHGFAVADFDGDGKMEFVATHASGRVYIAENTGDNAYALVWQDSTPFQNFYDIGQGDADNEGKVEFFTGGVMSDGSWTLVYSADSDNAYSAKLLIHLLSGGLLAGTQYFVADMDGDGKAELAIKVGGEIYVFKSDAAGSFHLWYLRRESVMDAVTLYDFNHDGLEDIVISRFVVNQQGRGMLFSDVYLASKIVSIKEQYPQPSEIQLLPNYPNPFNPQTSIQYVLGRRATIRLSIYNILGEHVTTLAHGEENAGRHQVVWDATGMSSGVYMCRLEVGGTSLSRKLLLVR